jgi:hypothetical protein
MRLASLQGVVLALVVSASGAGTAPNVTGSWAGNLRIRPGARTAEVALAVTQTGRQLAGTLALGVGDPALDGSYQVLGRARGRNVRLTGVGAGAVGLVLRGRLGANGLRGTVRLRAPHVRVRGVLALAPRVPTGDGTNCDAVFSANQPFFTDQVMGRVLVPICAACHVAGGQAQATRLRVVRGDALARRGRSRRWSTSRIPRRRSS